MRPVVNRLPAHSGRVHKVPATKRRRLGDGHGGQDGGSRLCDRRRGVGGLRPGRSAVGVRPPLRRASGGGRRRPSHQEPRPVHGQPDDPRARGLRRQPEGPQGQLAVRDRARSRHRRAHPHLAAGQGAGRIVVHQRHALRARPARGLRRLAADGLSRLGVGRRGAVLQEGRAPGARRRRPARRGRPPERRGHDRRTRGLRRRHRGRRAGGGSPREGPQRRRSGGRGLVSGDPEERRPLVHRRRLPSPRHEARQSARRDRRPGHPRPLRGQARRGRRIPPGRAAPYDPRPQGGDPGGRGDQLAPAPAAFRHRAGGAPARQRGRRPGRPGAGGREPAGPLGRGRALPAEEARDQRQRAHQGGALPARGRALRLPAQGPAHPVGRPRGRLREEPARPRQPRHPVPHPAPPPPTWSRCAPRRWCWRASPA